MNAYGTPTASVAVDTTGDGRANEAVSGDQQESLETKDSTASSHVSAVHCPPQESGRAPKCPSAEHTMLISNYSKGVYSSGYTCNCCGRQLCGSRWFCPRCSDDLCFDCAPTTNATLAIERFAKAVCHAPSCSLGHTMVISNYSFGDYSGGYACNKCQLSYSPAAAFGRRWFCSRCGEDICFNCVPGDVAAPCPRPGGIAVTARLANPNLWAHKGVQPYLYMHS